MKAKLSYSNVMATVAVFIALGAGAYAAVTLERNSVTSKHIKDGQVKPADLSKDVRTLGFSYFESSGTPNRNVLDAGPYRLFAQCGSAAGRPELTVALEAPKTGTLDSNVSRDKGAGAAIATLGRAPIDGKTPIDIIETSPDQDGIFSGTGGQIVYTAGGRTALLSLVALANDGADANGCSLDGTITPAR